VQAHQVFDWVLDWDLENEYDMLDNDLNGR
jgi:hypothetical protein